MSSPAASSHSAANLAVSREERHELDEAEAAIPADKQEEAQAAAARQEEQQKKGGPDRERQVECAPHRVRDPRPRTNDP
jgi:hypothetical protein